MVGYFSLPKCKHVHSNFSKKHLMLQDNGDELNEKRMFHGTRDTNIPLICKEGFDFRVANRGRIGSGNYISL